MANQGLKIGLIGGTGLDNPNLMSNISKISVRTRYGKPSDLFTTGFIGNNQIFIVPRHGSKHTLPPHKVNYRANIAALKKLGVDIIIATTSTGSLKEEIHPGQIVFPDQFIDFTNGRKNTFYNHFKNASEGHTPMADPFSLNLRRELIHTAQKLSLDFHERATLVTIQGPRFSTRAESFMFQKLGGEIITMSVATECELANEAKIPYAAVAMATDYDCWKEGEEAVSHDQVLATFAKNVEKVTSLLIDFLKNCTKESLSL